jgi:trehalose 6-phosphate synthase
LRIGLIVACLVGLAAAGVAWIQIAHERTIDEDDLHRRAQTLAHQIEDTVSDALAAPDTDARRMLRGDLDGFRRLVGFAVFRPNGDLLASGKGVTEFADAIRGPALASLHDRKEISETVRSEGTLLHVLSTPMLNGDGEVRGALVVVHDISHLEIRSTNRLMRAIFGIGALTLMLIVLVVGGTWLSYDRPLQNLADWMRRLRTGDVPEAPPGRLPIRLLASESDRLAASFRAARATNWEESRGVVRDHNVWTRDRLRAYAMDSLRGGQLLVVSNREPYMHLMYNDKPQVIKPAGGLVTALDPVLQACGGVWIAHGSGDGDPQTADEHGRLSVPPEDPRYTLRRVWLTREAEQGYYYGFSNEGLWPLCHLAHERPVFRTSDWDYYQRANRSFADAVLDEVREASAMVLVQDYQLALVPQLLKSARPDLRVGIFWHIPWPNPEAFRICPFRNEILHGMLGADLIGFHLQQYCNNFLDTVDRMIEARLDWDHFAVEQQGLRSIVRPFPISVESWNERSVPSGAELQSQIAQLRRQHGLGDSQVIVGVERIDYTKGLAERFRAIARFLEKGPEYRGKYTFVVLGAPSRTHIRRYRDLVSELESQVDEINWQFQTDAWKPIRFLVSHHDAATVHSFMHMAPICIVSSLHDGMNLVAKEFVAAKDNDDGVLILSEFAGAARELSDALIINPYDTEQFADAIRYAVTMNSDERQRRMRRMRQTVEESNVYRWAARFIGSLANSNNSGSNVLKREALATSASR